EKLADLLDLLPAGFFSADGDGVILYVNQTLARWLGVSPDRLVGTAFADFVAETGSEGDLKLKDAEGRTFSALLEQSQRDGDTGDVAYTRSLVLRDFIWRDPAAGMDADGAHAIASPFEPVSGERLRWLYDEAPVGILLLDLDGNISDCNRAFLKLLGCHRDMVVGAPFAEHISREDRGDVSASLSKIVMGTARAAHMEVRLPTSGDSELTISLYASRMEDGSGDISGLVLHFIDATEQKNLEIQFTQSQKMQAVGQLAGGVAHDFNNLLTAMIGFCDLLLARHGPEDPSFADIQQIRQNAKRATNLVRQLLAFSRQQTLTAVRLDITETLSELSNLLGRLIGETVGIRFEHGRDIVPVRVDRGQFDQVIINLAVNARDAMPGGGSLVIRTSKATFDTPTQRGHDLVPAGCYTLIEVADTGTGIAREDMARIFEPFFSTKEVGAGTGLGLSTVYGIVHQTGGFIFVDSALGEGTTFSIYLPECADDEEQADAEAVPSAASDADLTGQGTVLLVEDEDAVRLFGARALRNKGYTVLEADNGESALDVINASDERIDLIISDVIMPGMDGHTLVNLVRHELPRVKVILMSGYAEDIFQDEINRDPTIEFLGKPFSLKEFAGKVKEVMERL
ncbi:MAG: Blue-light-activated protein, partial [Alphaproteobacteria bacterium MarineAlpha3_Bin4]